jgi:TolB-like protein
VSANQASQPQSERLMQEMQQDDTAQPVNDLPDRTMAEATTSVPAEPLSDQLEQLIAEEAAKEQQRQGLSTVAMTPQQPPAKPQLQRRQLPSEQMHYADSTVAASMYPELVNSRKQLTDYALQLAFKLAGDMQLSGIKMGVSSFVEFDDSLRQTNALGNQFAEAMATLLPEYGVQVIEFKLTRHLAVGPQGDLALSRDIKKLQRNVGMDYLLVGTLVTTRRGVQINSRVVSVAQHQVIASASTLIPHLVLQQIQP